jgi:uncharacterized phage-associated protein
MSNHSAKAIANEFLKRRASSAWPSQMFIQKLAYIAHGWNLAINGEPLIAEAPEAWDNGPVYRSIWEHVRDFGYRGPNKELTHPETGGIIEEALTGNERQVIDHVWKKYGVRSPNELSGMTHQPGTPWSKAYFRYRNAPLANEDITDHYINLALAGRENNRA